MLTIFIGLFFILLDLPIAVDSIIGVRSASSVFDLLADFVGYIIIYMGLRSLSGNGKKFKMAETLSWVMFGIGLVEWVTYGIGLGEDFSFALWICDILVEFGALAVLYYIVGGIDEMSIVGNVDIKSKRLKTAYIVLAGAVIIMLILHFIDHIGAVEFVWTIIRWICAIAFIFFFYKTKKRYYEAIAVHEEELAVKAEREE
ncbi:MAG: hypothetical protein J6L92_00120 [Clostridia bacterium]|nr:hypothetical protein [Clostridia bacterium]